MSGHCRHCAEQCNAEDPIGWSVLGVHRNCNDGEGVEWRTGHCPMCAEAERIAAEVELKVKCLSAGWGLTGDLRDYCGPNAAYLAGMLDVAKIARGDQ